MRQPRQAMMRTVETEARIGKDEERGRKRRGDRLAATPAKGDRVLAAGVNSRSAMGSLEHIRDRQAHMAARPEAGDELAAPESGADLDGQLLEAGISGKTSSADDILLDISGPSRDIKALPSQ